MNILRLHVKPLSNQEVTLVETRARSKFSQISTWEQTLQHKGNKLAFFMKLYQLHTVEKLAARQCLGDYITNICISRNLQCLDFSMLDYLSNKMNPHIDVFGSLMIGWILWRVYYTLTITFNNDNLTLKFQVLFKTFKP